jgi:branched-chain amino acid transport system ATP-binding protein
VIELALEDARVAYGSVEVLHGVTMGFPAGALVAVGGRNGAGKSTLLRALVGLLPFRSGRLRWRGEDVTDWTTGERARAGLTLVPDLNGVFTSLTVRENLGVFAGRAPLDAAFSLFPELRDLAQAEDRPAAVLSGGQRQMLALARIVLRRSQVVLLDEPSRGLAPPAVAGLYAGLARLAAEGRTVVVVEQYLDEVLRSADVVYVLRRGELAFAGEPAELGATT